MNEQDLLGYLRDAAQGASNSAASTVSGPVDLLAWLLRKGGVPVGDAPVMGSDWMAQRGFTAQPKNALAGLAGETVGNILPIAAAAKAPQIANALIRVQDAAGRGAVALGQKGADMAGDYMARQGMIQPATVWHGSPHKFDAFDSSKIGTGEGAQAYGHGLYLADSPSVAKDYAEKLSSAGLAKHALAQNAGQTDAAIAAAEQSVKNYQALIANGGGGDMRRANGMLALAQKKLADLQAIKAGTLDETGNLYKVDLPDSAIARMLDWDKPLSQQAPEVQKSVTDAMLKRGITKSVADYIVANKTGNEALATISRGAYDARLNVPDGPQAAAASQMLQSAGIPGIRYLDGGSRGAGAGTSNYVVFPGEENMLRILERNGVPIGK